MMLKIIKLFTNKWNVLIEFISHIIQYMGQQNIVINIKKHKLLFMVDDNLFNIIINKGQIVLLILLLVIHCNSKTVNVQYMYWINCNWSLDNIFIRHAKHNKHWNCIVSYDNVRFWYSKVFVFGSVRLIYA